MRPPEVLPTPKSMEFADGALPLAESLTVAAVGGEEAVRAARWLADQLEIEQGVACRPAERATDAQVIIGLLDDLTRVGLADIAWRRSTAFATPLGRAQGYVLDVGEERAILTALTGDGLRHAAATALQLIGPDGMRRGRVEDRPDFALRAADWLLNVEINRWAYERGDGREALFARLRRKLDLAARCKLNLVWFDGFGWDPERVPGYAQEVRALARYARERGIRLAHTGYGGGYGFVYQQSELYAAPYMGRAFENRRPWPDGPLYDCIGEPHYEESWHWGTCLSNEGLQDAKLAELTRFVAACEPGLLYIHDIDAGRWQGATHAWLRRCDECRRRWPSDDATAPDGMAGAYAAWFRRVVDAVGAIASDDGDYHAARDCGLVFVGPVYAAADEADEDRQAECRYFETVSRLIGPAANVQFGVRELLLSEPSGRPRVRELAERLDAVGAGHGVFVVAFCGGDAYHSDQLVSASPTLNRYFAGARTIYSVHFGGVAEPAQVVAAQYAWNADAPGAAPVADGQAEAMAQLEASRSGTLCPPEVFGQGGLLARACELLYGPCAGPHLAQVFAATAPEDRPVAMTWHTITREAARLRAPGDIDATTRGQHWRARRRATSAALAQVEEALACGDPLAGTCEDLDWLRRCLELGRRFCVGLALSWEALQTGDGAEVAACWAELTAHIRSEFPRDRFDPVGGDIAAAEDTAELLREWAGQLR